jgi:DNA-directed RNA polymerase subunit M/transcription elongation factor TFIIS
MNAYASSGQESGESVDERRADSEEFSMVVLGGDGGGHVNVRNESYDDPNEHIYTVHVEGGEADWCSCPHALYRDVHCKHQRAVEHRPLIVSSADAASAATTGQQVATDGGTQQVAPTDDSDTEADDHQTDDSDDKRQQTDHWSQPVKHFDAEPVGAGEKSECQSCGSRFEIAMIAATAENNRNWEEFYECQQCGATGSFRFHGKTERREWTGRIAYPD